MTVNVSGSISGVPLSQSSQVYLAQLDFLGKTMEVCAQFNPLLKTSVDTFREAIDLLKSQIELYDVEENLVSTNPVLNLFNGVNPYHSFLEGQKSRKLFFESALVSLKVLKNIFPFQAPLMQQMENFIRTNSAFTFTFKRPDWNLDFEHEVVNSLDFVDVVKFPASKENTNGRNMLLVAPMSGHFATLLRKTIEGLHNAGYTVFITDWKSPFDVSKDKGDFGIDRQTEEILNTYSVVGDDVGDFDVLAVCQPSPETMTATAYAEEQNLPRPRSISLMAGPIDVSQSPTAVNEASGKLTPEVLDMMKLAIPRGRYEGAGRDTYPAFLQIFSFMATKPEEHLKNYRSLAFKTTAFTGEEEKMLAFYTEYFAILDLYHEFYKQTVQGVFRGNKWATGKVDFKGGVVDFSKMKTPLVTIEGANDDICGIGQTSAAHTIAPNTEGYLHILVPDAGHYGTFAGKGFRGIVLPQLDQFYSSLAK